MTKFLNFKQKYFDQLDYWNLFGALLSRFWVPSGLMYHDPFGKSKVVDFEQNHLTG